MLFQATHRTCATVISAITCCSSAFGYVPIHSSFLPRTEIAVTHARPAAILAADSTAKTYDLKMSYTNVVDTPETYTVEGKRSAARQISKDGSIVSRGSKYLEVNMRLVETPSQVSDGKVIKSKIVVASAKGRSKGDEPMKTLACQGATLAVTRLPKLSFARADGKEISPTDQELLSMAISPHDPKEAPIDDLFGPGKNVRIGDTWQPSKDKMNAYYGSMFELPAKDLDTSAKLVGSDTVNSKPCLLVSVDVTAKSLKTKANSALRNVSGTLNLHLDQYVSPKPDELPLRSHLQEAATIRGTMEAAEGTMQIISGTEQTIDIVFLKP